MKQLNKTSHWLSLALMLGLPGLSFTMQQEDAEEHSLENLYELSIANQTGPQPHLDLYKLLAELDLSKSNLREVSPAIGSMQQLRRLNLEDNGLRTLPTEIGSAKKIKRLNLGRNYFETVPEGVTQLSSLEELNLGRNQLTQLPDLSTLKKMKRLKLGRNKLAELPSSLTRLSNLHELDASNNQLTELPDISNLNSLKKLELSQNPLGMSLSEDEKPAISACSTALALYRIIGKNCIHAAHKLHTTLGSQTEHTYLKKVLTGLFARAKDTKDAFSLALIPQALTKNDHFCANLKQSMSGIHARIDEKPDPAIPALKELHKHLHYYSWLEALNSTQKAYCTSPFYTEPFKGLPENLQLIIWSMIHDSY